MNRSRRLPTGFIFLTLLTFLATSCPADFPDKAPGDRETVLRSLEEVKREEIEAIKQGYWQAHIFSQLEAWVQSNQFFIYLLLVLGLASFVALIIYFIIRFIIAGRRRRKLGGKEFPHEVDTPGFAIRELDALVRSGQYSNAVLLLHRGTVEFLLDEKVLATHNLTNYSIATRITNKPIRQAFLTIALFAERILFDCYEAAEEDFRLCRKTFSRHFVRLRKA